MGLQKAQHPTKQELIEFIVIKKSDIKNNEINFKWIHSREFKLNDELYDIVKRNEDEVNYYLYCINDKKEKELELKIEENVEKNTANNKITQNQLQNILIFIQPFVYNPQINRFNKDFTLNSLYINNYKSVTTEIITPPPQFA